MKFKLLITECNLSHGVLNAKKCFEPVVATWFNSSGEKFLLCKDHLDQCLKFVLEVKEVAPDVFVAQPEKEEDSYYERV